MTQIPSVADRQRQGAAAGEKAGLAVGSPAWASASRRRSPLLGADLELRLNREQVTALVESLTERELEVLRLLG